MEELENLRSDSEVLEAKILTPDLKNILKLIIKLTVGFFAGIYFVYGGTCGQEVDDLIKGSSISLFLESLILLFYLLLAYNYLKCLKFASYCTIIKMILDFMVDMFYIGWGIYIIIIYFNENSCNENMTFTDVVGLGIVVYYLAALSLMTCCCGAKVCICASTMIATTKTEVDRRLSRDLINIIGERTDREE
jgi:hypothetical protein